MFHVSIDIFFAVGVKVWHGWYARIVVLPWFALYVGWWALQVVLVFEISSRADVYWYSRRQAITCMVIDVSGRKTSWWV